MANMNRSTAMLVIIAALAICVGIAVWLWPLAAEPLSRWLVILQNPDQARALFTGWGPIRAPAAFIGIQILQVIFAPIPGEASGFVGGYLFGTVPGFVYSTIGLTIGSVFNFFAARVLGRRYVERWVPVKTRSRLDALTRRQGVLVFFLCFVIPGFPKDYLCIFLGLTALSPQVFVIMAAVGRMPGTLMLSLQGAQVFQKDYVMLVVLVGVTL
ncbi:MAG: TVP38/TMEM64 family protein, partial [Deltaproteobacteria bacterium]|nr:TVP38/TMEM64 family protein [Deltaproteobacteria bacterium]